MFAVLLGKIGNVAWCRSVKPLHTTSWIFRMLSPKLLPPSKIPPDSVSHRHRLNRNRKEIQKVQLQIFRSFYRVTQLCNRGLGSCNSVRLSVCHTRALWLIQRIYRQYFYTTWKGNPSSSLTPKVAAKFQQVTPQRGRQIEVGWVKTPIFDQYFTNGAK